MISECEGCGSLADVVAVYEGDDPSTGYVGSDEPEFLCWECRHPFTQQIVAAEQRANALAMRLLGVHPDELAESKPTASSTAPSTAPEIHSDPAVMEWAHTLANEWHNGKSFNALNAYEQADCLREAEAIARAEHKHAEVA